MSVVVVVVVFGRFVSSAHRTSHIPLQHNIQAHPFFGILHTHNCTLSPLVPTLCGISLCTTPFGQRTTIPARNTFPVESKTWSIEYAVHCLRPPYYVNIEHRTSCCVYAVYAVASVMMMMITTRTTTTMGVDMSRRHSREYESAFYTRPDSRTLLGHVRDKCVLYNKHHHYSRWQAVLQCAPVFAKYISRAYGIVKDDDNVVGRCNSMPVLHADEVIYCTQCIVFNWMYIVDGIWQEIENRTH